jgi:Glyoxalase-like domain
MAVSFQLVIDCADPEPLVRFWAAALGYELEPPPDGFASWDMYRRDLRAPEDELGAGADCIVDLCGRALCGSGSRWYRSAKRPRTGCTSISVSVAAARFRSRRAGSASTRRRVVWLVWVPSSVSWTRVRHQLTAAAARPVSDLAPAFPSNVRSCCGERVRA